MVIGKNQFLKKLSLRLIKEILLFLVLKQLYMRELISKDHLEINLQQFCKNSKVSYTVDNNEKIQGIILREVFLLMFVLLQLQDSSCIGYFLLCFEANYCMTDHI